MQTMAATSVRSVDDYHDPSLDNLIGQSNSIIRGSSYRRNGGGNSRAVSDYSNTSSNPPPAPEVPRGPPISYRGGGREANVPQRSFSQRAKGRPFAREALADDEEVGYGPPRIQKNNVYPRNSTQPPAAGRSRAEAPLQLNTAMPRDNSARQVRPPQVQAVGSPRNPRPRSYQPQDTETVSQPLPQEPEPFSPRVRSNTLQSSSYATDEQRRDWAPDRSPLQKLEVTLNDISKEEKRARVEEAEMLLRESKAGRGGRRISRELPPLQATTTSSAKRHPSLNAAASRQESRDLEEAGLVRNLTTTQRDRLKHSTTVDAQKPDVRRLSGEGRRGFDYGEQNYHGQEAGMQVQTADKSPTELRVPSVRQNRARDSLPASGRMPGQGPEILMPERPQYGKSDGKRREDRHSQDISRKSLDEDSSDGRDMKRAASMRHSSATQSVPSNITRAVSMQSQQPQAHFPEDREPVRAAPATKNANSSHKAALTEATIGGTMGATAINEMYRSNSRKLQKAPPAGYDRRGSRTSGGSSLSADAGPISPDQLQMSSTANNDVHVGNPRIELYERGTARQINLQKGHSRHTSESVGLGLRESPPTPPDGPRQQSAETTPERPRRQSVSFRQPFDQTRPKDEWKQAGVARLTLADMSLAAEPTGSRDQAWWEANRKQRRTSGARDSAGAPDRIDDKSAKFEPVLYLRCGPLLRYTGTRRTPVMKESAEPQNRGDAPARNASETWRGSVMIVTQDSHSSYTEVPLLRLFSQPKRLLPPPPQEVEGEELAPEYIDPIAGLTKVSRNGQPIYVRPIDHLPENKDLSTTETDEGLFEGSPSPLDLSGGKGLTSASTNNRTLDQDGESLGKYQEVRGVRLYADPLRDVTFWRFNIEVELGDTQQHIAYRINRGPAIGFWVPARGESMNIMFHSCNGFSMSVNPDFFSGPDPMWRDVLNTHQTRPFHVMIGGGDQVYNDRVMIETKHFGEWTRIRNPQHKHHAPFSPEMKEELEDFYLHRYSMWFSQGLFSMANAQIPMVNMWDDHDIIDGFGSYPDHFMRSAVFEGLGGIAHKYYLLFQHQCVPEETTADEPSWIMGTKPGPYIHQLSRSIFMNMGTSVAFLGLDCRTERRRDEILSLDTYDLVLERCRKEIIEGETKHLILLLGIPIAYPRLVWLENVLTSRAMDPIKALGRVGFLGGFLNKFDGGVEILDDLDDHWTATHHKEERNIFIQDLQDLAAEKSVRVTILGGDVHLAAIGQFYSNPKLKIPKDRDHRYMPNVISSAIVNTPPPEMMGDILNKRNKVHHLNKYTDENMIPMFTHDVDGKKRNNKHLLPRRNWCSIREYVPGHTPPPTPPETPSASESDGEEKRARPPQRRFSFSMEDVNPRNLMRRLSSRGPPPTSYRDATDSSNPGYQLRPASMDGSRMPQRQNGFMGSPLADSTPQRASYDGAQPINHGVDSGKPHPGPTIRPGFLRRPTNLSEKAARKGNMMALDRDGNEFDVNDHINLEGGLDIVINCEVNPKDPAGITTPYRLLVPALWYDGSSDREKLDDHHEMGVQRKPTLLGRMGLRRGRRARAAQHQGPGEGDQEEGSESYDGSEDMQDSPPRRRFGFFGLGRRRKEEDDDDHFDEERQPTDGATHQVRSPSQDLQARERGDEHVPISAPDRTRYTFGTQPAPPREMQHQNHSPQMQSPQVRQTAAPSKMHYQNDLPPMRQPSMGRQPEPQPEVQYEDESPPIAPLRQSSKVRRASPTRQIYDQITQQPTSRQQNYSQTAPHMQADSSAPRPSKQERLLGIDPGSNKFAQIDSANRPSKQERVLGMDPGPSQFPQPGQTPLRGNGIIGRGYAEAPHQQTQAGYGARPSQGYSGIEAYQDPKPRRRWSLRGTRKWIGDGRILGWD